MYSIVSVKRFKKSFKKLSRSGRYDAAILEDTLNLLAFGKPLPQKYQNHFLSGVLAEYEECHIQGDLLLIYKRNKEKGIITLYDIGTHSELFGQ